VDLGGVGCVVRRGLAWSARTGCIAALAFGLRVPDARAETGETKDSGAEASVPPDLVVLKSGGMIRGTISELVPDERVVIMLVTGEVRTVEMDQVEYAGPAANAPMRGSKEAREHRVVTDIEKALIEGQYEEEEAPAPSKGRSAGASRHGPVEVSGSSQVTFVSKQPGLHVHMLIGSGKATLNFQSVSVEAYRSLCTTPCTVELEPGSYKFGVSSDGSDPAGSDDFVYVESGSTVEVEHHSHTGTRVAGWITMIGGGIAGAALMFSASNDCDVADPDCDALDTGQVLAGVGVFAVAAFVGYFLAIKSDSADAEVAIGATVLPAVVRRSVPGGEFGALSVLPVQPGLGVHGTF
jgi:hypothetical protein